MLKKYYKMNNPLIKSIISSVIYSDKEFFNAISELYGFEDIDLDPCYSKGNFYRELSFEPKYRFDIEPIRKECQKADCRNLPLANESINTIVFDPPFMFGTHGQTKNNIMNKRFSMFDTFEELENMYKESLIEFWRILKKGGYLFFKCQDYTDSKTTMTHCLVYNWAAELGFYAKDIAILVKPNKVTNPNTKQRHLRKIHTYFWVFIKS